MRLRGRNALVTGTSPGIGHAIARALAAEGARVFCHARREADAFEHWTSVLELEHVVGDFVWTALDYLGGRLLGSEIRLRAEAEGLAGAETGVRVS